MGYLDYAVDLHKLRIFAAVARLGSFTRAAERLHMTQPTVSQQIATLERELEVSLFERDTRHLRLTPSGEALLPYAEKLLMLADEAKETARAAAGMADRTLRIGVGHVLATYLLPPLLSDYRRLYPQAHVHINVGNTAELLSHLAAETIDLALVGSPAEHPDIVAAPFMQDRLVVIVPPNDEWAAQETISLDQLRGRVLLTREPGSALHASVERLMGAEALLSDNVIQLGETEAIKRSVEAGLGVALIQSIAIKREVEAGNLRALQLVGGDDVRTYLIAHRRRGTLSAAAEQLRELLLNLSSTSV